MIEQITKEQTKVADTSKPMKILINSRTIINIKDKNRLEFWLAKYPEAKIIN